MIIIFSRRSLLLGFIISVSNFSAQVICVIFFDIYEFIVSCRKVGRTGLYRSPQSIIGLRLGRNF